MNVFYFYLFILVHPYLAMWWKSFDQAGRAQWEALIPGYNYFVVFKLGAKKPFWSLLLVFPGVHIVMWSVANLSYIRRFGYFSLVDSLQGIFFPYIIMYKIANSGDKMLPETNWANSKEVGDREWGDHLALFLSLPILGHVVALGIASVTRAKPGKKTKVKEWGDSIWFALVAALIIRTYVFEPFKIPTGSMENTLLVGDFLFVNKLAYGPKVPVTPVSYPLVHNTVPWVNIKSYVGLETSDYTRLWGYSDVERYDVVVFNYPAGDTAVYDPYLDGLMGHNYYNIVNQEALRIWLQESDVAQRESRLVSKQLGRLDPNILFGETRRRLLETDMKDFFDNIEKWQGKARAYIASGKTEMQDQYGGYVTREHYGVVYRPVDKRENYIKRCVGLPGDYLEVINSQLYVNGKKAPVFENQLLRYNALNFTLSNPGGAWERYGIDVFMNNQYRAGQRDQVDLGNDSIPVTEIYVNQKGINKLRKTYNNQTFTLHRKLPYTGSMDTVSGQVLVENMGIFPNDPYVNNTVTDVKKFWVPKKGVTVTLTADNIPYYRRIISAFEGHSLKENKDGTFTIDGKKTNKYTFEMDYYWMMGDNRFNSADSRMWGFVPEDHVVGKASMVWFSRGPSGVRWDRLFKLIE